MLIMQKTSYLERLEGYMAKKEKVVTTSLPQKNTHISRIKDLFRQLKELHENYKLYGKTIVRQNKVIREAEPVIRELERLGVRKVFSETLLFFGKEFLDFEWPDSETHEIDTDLRNKRIRREKGTDIVSTAEEIFGVKATQMTPEEIKVHKQVAGEALVYTVKAGKPEILLYKKGKGSKAEKGGYAPQLEL